jgi:antitoxin component HigA of HigAB toxin-antitoxin module
LQIIVNDVQHFVVNYFADGASQQEKETPMEERHSAIRRALLTQWLAEHERSQAWVARQIGATRSYMSNVLLGKRPFTDKLARRLHDKLGISFDYRDPIMERDDDPAEVGV